MARGEQASTETTQHWWLTEEACPNAIAFGTSEADRKETGTEANTPKMGNENQAAQTLGLALL
jgi:hypothetical protein